MGEALSLREGRDSLMMRDDALKGCQSLSSPVLAAFTFVTHGLRAGKINKIKMGEDRT